MKNIEYNFCRTSMSTSRRGEPYGKNIWLGPLVLKESEDTPVRLDLNIITYLNIQ